MVGKPPGNMPRGRGLISFLSSYRRMELATIGPWRFAAKLWTASHRLMRRTIAACQAPRLWSATLFCDDPAPAAIAGAWLYASRADLSVSGIQTAHGEVLARAERYRQRVFYVNGKEIRQAGPPCNGRWDVDPVSGGRWPEASPFAPCFTGPGDIRFIWELDRMHHLACFGQAWRLTGDSKWPAAIVEHTEVLLSEAPYERGIHWYDGLQLGIRIFSFVAAADLCHDSGAATHRCLNNAVLGHALALRRQMSPNSALTNNHSIGEASGLVLAGLFLDRQPVARRLVAEGLQRLEVELGRQLYGDGMPYEGALPYVRFDLEFLLLLIPAFKSSGKALPGWLRDAAVRMAGALAAMADRAGRIPPIGDGDDGRVLRLDNEPYLTVNETLHLAERLLDLRNLAPAEATGGFAFWVAGPPIDKGQKQERCRGGDLSVHLPDCGMIHIRRGSLDLWVDSGPTGLGPKGPGGHGHNDTTAIVVHLDGVALLHDPGWYTYYGDRAMRDRLRSTAAHNTVTVDGAEQARLGGLFEILNECRPAQTRMRCFRDGTIGIVCGHNGFERLGKGVLYRRYISISGDRPWRILVADVVRARSSVVVRSHIGSDLPWQFVNGALVCGAEGHKIGLRGGQQNLQINKTLCSRETGVLDEGYSINWDVPGSQSCVSRWRLSIAGQNRRGR